MADLSTTRQGRTPKDRTGTPVRPGHSMRRIQLACGHLQRDRIARPGDLVWCEAGCSDWVRATSVDE